MSRVTTPHHPQGQGLPDQGPYGGQPGQYGPPPGQQSPPPGQYGPQHGGQYGPPPGQYQGPPGQYGGQQSPYGGQQPYEPATAQQPFTYNPYGSAPVPAGLQHDDVAPVQRPGLMIVAFVLTFVATLPFLLGGALALIAPPSPDELPAAVLANPRLVQAGMTPDLLVSIVRLVGAIALFVAAAYLMFALIALTGKKWARVVLTIMTALFVLLIVIVTPFGELRGAGVGLFGAIILLSLGGVVLLYLPGPSRYLASAHR